MQRGISIRPESEGRGVRPATACLTTFGLIVLAAFSGGCGGSREFPDQPITLVCPWAAGGGTDRVSRQMAAHLEADLGVPVNVINATGGKGVIGHSRGLDARPDGYTLAMITLELNMMHWSGLTDLTYRDCIPLWSVNEDYAALFVRGDAPWQTLSELEAAIRERRGGLKASGTTAGGAWHLALAGWLLSAGLQADDVVWISSTGAGPSLQELLSGGLDMVCCSLPEAEALFRSGELRVLGVMGPERVNGYEQVPTFAEQGSDWTLGGWRGLALPLGTPPDRVEHLREAIGRVVSGETVIETSSGPTTFPQFMEAAGFDNRARPAHEFRMFLVESDEKFGRLLTSPDLQSVNVDRFSPMTFPGALLAMIGATWLGLAVSGLRQAGRQVAIGKTGEVELVTSRGRISFAAVVAAVLLYLLLAEVVGFLLVIGFLLLGLMVWWGTRPWVALLIAGVTPPLVYQVFAHLLRVPLPRGWLGW